MPTERQRQYQIRQQQFAQRARDEDLWFWQGHAAPGIGRIVSASGVEVEAPISGNTMPAIGQQVLYIPGEPTGQIRLREVVLPSLRRQPPRPPRADWIVSTAFSLNIDFLGGGSQPEEKIGEQVTGSGVLRILISQGLKLSSIRIINEAGSTINFALPTRQSGVAQINYTSPFDGLQKTASQYSFAGAGGTATVVEGTTTVTDVTYSPSETSNFNNARVVIGLSGSGEYGVQNEITSNYSQLQPPPSGSSLNQSGFSTLFTPVPGQSAIPSPDTDPLNATAVKTLISGGSYFIGAANGTSIGTLTWGQIP